jgi:hypothetical protein
VKLLQLTQIENGKTFYINHDEIASINPTFKLKPEVILGEDHNIYYTLITLKNGVKVSATESPYAIAFAQPMPTANSILVPLKEQPQNSVVATEPWSPEANFERSKQVQGFTP